MTFLPADSEGGQNIYLWHFFGIFLGLPVGIFLAFGIGHGIFLGFFWDFFGICLGFFLHFFDISLGFFLFFFGILLPSGAPEFSNVFSSCFL